MTSKYEELDTIVHNYTNAATDIQYIENYGTLCREEVSPDSGPIRSSEVFGRFQLPEVGKRFTLVAEPFDKTLPLNGAFRVVSTSVVKRVEQEKGSYIYFWTENSKYALSLKPKN